MWDVKALKEQRDAEVAKVQAIFDTAKDEKRDLSDEESLEVDRIQGTDEKEGSIQSLDTKIKRAERARAITSAKAVAMVSGHGAADLRGGGGGGQDVIDAVGAAGGDEPKRVRVPATAKRTGALKCFKGPSAMEDAYLSGRFLMAAIGGDEGSKKWLSEHGVQMAHNSDENSKGGYLVPDVFENVLIDLKESYGVFRQEAMNWPMSSDTSLVPRRVSGFTTYFVGQNQEITQSETAVDQIKLEAKKLAGLTQFSSELSEDSIISVADFYAREFAYALAVKEDSCGFLGDGTSTYGGIIGLANALNAGSIKTATGITALADVTLANFEAVVAALPEFEGIQPAWYVSKPVYHLTMGRLQVAAGGNTVSDLGSGPVREFLGYPVRFVHTLPKAGASGTKIAYFGDLAMTATMGTRRGVTLRADESVFFKEDALALRVTERFDINVHERGSASEAGPMIQLKLG